MRTSSCCPPESDDNRPPHRTKAAANRNIGAGAIVAAGLRLESRKAPVEVFIVDHAEKTPTAN